MSLGKPSLIRFVLAVLVGLLVLVDVAPSFAQS